MKGRKESRRGRKMMNMFKKIEERGEGKEGMKKNEKRREMGLKEEREENDKK